MIIITGNDEVVKKAIIDESKARCVDRYTLDTQGKQLAEGLLIALDFGRSVPDAREAEELAERWAGGVLSHLRQNAPILLIARALAEDEGVRRGFFDVMEFLTEEVGTWSRNTLGNALPVTALIGYDAVLLETAVVRAEEFMSVPSDPGADLTVIEFSEIRSASIRDVIHSEAL